MRIVSMVAGAWVALGAAACDAGGPDHHVEEAVPGEAGKADWFGDDAPFADLYRSSASTRLLPIRGRLVEEDPDDIGALDVTPLSQVSQDELEDERVGFTLHTAQGDHHALGETVTDDEGYLDLLLDIEALGVAPGEHTLEAWIGDDVIGETTVTLMDIDRVEPVVRSDVDWTYLRTDFQGVSALTQLVRQDAYARETLPAMDLVYQGLRDDAKRPITFLTGSPQFFKRTLEAKAMLDDVTQDGIVLKPFKDIISAQLLSDPTGILPDLHEQLGYKLHWLLRLRAELPASTPEILIGDDSEADFVAYGIYARLLQGELEGPQLRETLVEAGVSDYWRPRILELSETLGSAAPPVAIYINRTEIPGDTYDLEAWRIEGLTRVYEGAWPLALDLFEEGWIESTEVEGIKVRLLELGDDEESLDARAARADFVSPQTTELF